MTQATDTLAQELEAIDTRLREMPMPFDLHPAVNDLLQFMEKAGPSIIEALRAKTPPEEAVEASKQIWKSMKRAFLKDAGPEYDEIGERIAIPHLVAPQPSPEQTEPSATHSEMREALVMARHRFVSWCATSIAEGKPALANKVDTFIDEIDAALAKLDEPLNGRAA